MQTGITGYVDRGEWRWVLSVSVAFVLATLIPYLIAVLFAANPQNTIFMGVLHDHMDTAASLARMKQGTDSLFLLDFLYSAEAQEATIMQPMYSLLGQLAVFSRLDIITMFHVLRIFVSLFMYLAIYYLGASIWVKARPRRIFFVIASIGAGFGWLIVPFMGINHMFVIPDMVLPHLYPLYASAANIHYPLAIACLALIGAIIVPVLRPGETIEPSVENGGGVVFLTSVVLAFVYPDALLPLGVAYSINVAFNWINQKKIIKREWYWGLWILVPALPVVAYNTLIYINNPQIVNWLMQRGSDVPNPLMLIVGLGLPFILALPGIARAIQKFEADGDRLMLLWLVSMVVAMYLPLVLNQYFLLGLMLPLSYFATRAIEDFWFNRMRRLYRRRFYMLGFVILIMSHIVWLFFPVYPLIAGWQGINAVTLENDYGQAFIWLDNETDRNSVVLASPDVSLWIPSKTGAHVVYGHPDETFFADTMQGDVLRYYQESTDLSWCDDFIAQFDVAYVVYGAREARLGAGDCTAALSPVITFNSVSIFSTDATDS